ncbi:MAG: hypothetical protein ACOH19_01380 [Rhodoglobus sp.]
MTGTLLACSAFAMSAIPATQAQPVEQATPAPAVKTVTAEHEERAATVIAEHLAFDEQLHDVVDTTGILGNSKNIKDSLASDEDLQVIVTLDHTEYARAMVAGNLAMAIDREIALHANSHPEAVARLTEIRDAVLGDVNAAFDTIGSPPLAEELAELLATIRG